MARRRMPNQSDSVSDLKSVAGSFRAACRVVKLGGSLFDAPHLANTLRRWWSNQTPVPCVWIAGGGALADAVRHWDSTHRLGESLSHELCLRLMSVSARFAQRLLTETGTAETVYLTANWSELRSRVRDASRPVHVVFDVGVALLTPPEPRVEASDSPPQVDEPEIPASWDVTSDSLAAYVASRLIKSGLPGCELVLLKSCEPPEPPTVAAAIAGGLVDAQFATFAAALPQIRFVTLQDNTTLDSNLN